MTKTASVPKQDPEPAQAKIPEGPSGSSPRHPEEDKKRNANR